jgi:cytochrome P450
MVGLDVTGKGYAARQIVFDAMAEYSKNIPSDAAFVLHERLRVFREAGISEEEAWKQESTFSFAVFPNTSPTLFWALFDIFSRPEILDAIRGELVAEAVSKDGDDFVLDVAAVKTKCHLILSMLQETQRTRGHTAGIRKVVSDTLLDGRYFLKKGNYIQMPTNPLSLSEKLWGPTAKTFDPFRFVPKETRDKTGPTGNKLMAWGFPPHLCPARQFAATEILIIVALLVLRVELTPATASGKWDKDFPFLGSDTATVPNPLKDIKLRVAPRQEGSGSWKLKMGNSMTRISLASG